MFQMWGETGRTFGGDERPCTEVLVWINGTAAPGF